MKQQPKILLSAPTSIIKDYIFLDWYLYVSNLTYQNYDIYIVDNSHDFTYHQELRRFGIDIDYVNPKGKKSVDYITESQNLIREKFLKGNYDYFFSLEVDIFPPRNIIEKLLSDKKDIVSVPYFLSSGYNTYFITQYFFKDKRGKLFSDIPDFEYAFDKFRGDVHQSYANGIGCTLIKRHILEKLKFRTNGKVHSDTLLYEDIFKILKIPNFIDTSTILVHHNSDWGENIDHKS